MTQKRKWSASAKFEIALQAIKGEITINEICTRYEVSPSQVHAWKKQLLDQGLELFSKHDKSAKIAVNEKEQIEKKLYEKIGKLTIERDFLKKSLERFYGKKEDD